MKQTSSPLLYEASYKDKGGVEIISILSLVAFSLATTTTHTVAVRIGDRGGHNVG